MANKKQVALIRMFGLKHISVMWDSYHVLHVWGAVYRVTIQLCYNNLVVISSYYVSHRHEVPHKDLQSNELVVHVYNCVLVCA